MLVFCGKVSITRAALAVIGVLLLPTSLAHRTFPDGITCGPQFGAPDTPLVIPNPAVSWANYALFTCEDPVQWFEATVDAGQMLYFTVTVPEIERFEDARMAVVFLGPGLPQSLPVDDGIPDAIRDYATTNDMGGVLYKSPQDQTTCDHLTSDEMKGAATVQDSRCHFYERFGGSNMWVVMDDSLKTPSAGVYKIAVYEQDGNTAKASFACCDWSEDFVTPYSIPPAECPACGSNASSNPAWMSLYYEQKTMADFEGYPPNQNCMKNATPIHLPEGDQCPDLDSLYSHLNQPQSCALGCSSTGECHSHNVFGECVHVLDWTLVPKFGDADVTQVVIFKGDKIRFIHSTKDGLAHNLFLMANETSINTCDFAGSQELAGVEEISIGHDYTFEEAGTFHFACGIGCHVGPTEMEAPPQSDGCHCQMGQQLIVEVKDATEGLRCHSHKQVPHTHNDVMKQMKEPLPCLAGTTNAFVVNNAGCGSIGEEECSEMCAPEFAIGFMTGVEKGSCIDLGYIFNPTTLSVLPPGSPQEVEVTILSNVAPVEEARNDNCHCHSYEVIACPEEESIEDTLYAEHIEEIRVYCQGILDGTETDCPYKCFQPMEVLHLHYIDCPTRVVDPIYIAVNATNMCHIAADAPESTDAFCPVVDLSSPNLGDSNWTIDFEDEEASRAHSRATSLVLAIVLVLTLTFLW